MIIEKNIPLPSALGGVFKGMGPVLKQMQVGDSVVMPKPRSMSSVYICAKGAGVKVVTRAVSDSEIRIWRKE